MQMLLNGLYDKITYSRRAIFIRAILAGLLIGFGGAMMLLVKADSAIPKSASAIFSGLVFSVGLYLVFITKAELFTGDNLMVLLHKTRDISFYRILSHLGIVYIGNLIGSLIMALGLFISGFSGDATSVSEIKCNIPIYEIILKGVLCNILVCLAVWINSKANGIVSMFLASAIPVICFVSLGFEHSVANMMILPLGLLVGADISLIQISINLLFVTIGNIIGGAIILPLIMIGSEY